MSNYENYHKLITHGPQNVDGLIADILTKLKTFFMSTGAKDFQSIYDLLEPHFNEYFERVYQECKKDPEFVSYMTDDGKTELGETARDNKGHQWYMIDQAHNKTAELAFCDNGIKNLIGEEMYDRIKTMTSDEAVKEWSRVRRNPLVEMFIAATPCDCIK